MKDRNINKNINKKINYSLQLLRIILSFWVVIHHTYKYAYKLHKGKFHVPIFMIMSFYFYYNTLNIKSIIKIKYRFQRISIPYIIWPFLLFICNNILFYFSICHIKTSFKPILCIKAFIINII
jgi:fucose 4-O-acetylase-like acetyltransferase